MKIEPDFSDLMLAYVERQTQDSSGILQNSKGFIGKNEPKTEKKLRSCQRVWCSVLGARNCDFRPLSLLLLTTWKRFENLKKKCSCEIIR